MSTAQTGYDLAVIGSGAAAFAAAIAAARKGANVVMIEHGRIGGTCVNTGCVPSKALLAAAQARHVAADQPFPGIRTEAGPVDFAALIGAKTALVDRLRAEKYIDLAAQYGWKIVHGHARFAPGPVVRVTLDGGGETTIEAAHYLIATGSSPWIPPLVGLSEVGYLTSATAMALDALPPSLVVIGGGYVGLEQAQLFARLGTRVTVVTRSRLASVEEPEVSAVLETVFADEGIAVHTHTQVRAVRHGPGGTAITTVTGPDGLPEELVSTHLLVATGRRPVTDGLGFDVVGVQVGRRGEIVVDEHLRTHHPQIWAAGDVTGHSQFVYVAGAHGTMVADNALDGAQRTLDYHHLPRVIFTTPAIAAAGLTEAAATAQDLTCDCRVLPLDAVPRALVNRDTRGLIKLVAEYGTGRLLGAHIIAADAGEVIATAVYALANQMTVAQMAELWCPYLTMAEGLKLAAQSYTRDVAKLSCCAS